MTAVAPAPTDRRRERGDRTRRTILEAAARLASVEGLEGLSIGRLAEHLEISKSGLYAHFRSKEELQLATIRTASEIYERDLVVPAMESPRGRDRLITFCDRFLEYIRSGPFPGGCFFIASTMDPARQRGSVNAALAEVQAALLSFFEEGVTDAQRAGQLSTELDSRQMAFAIDGILIGADLNFLLFGDATYLDLARAEIRRLL
jgi:AcrR family transcriptional regulator